MATLEDKALWENQDQEEDDDVGQDILRLAPEEVNNRTRLLENDIKVMKSEIVRLKHEQAAMKERIKDNVSCLVQYGISMISGPYNRSLGSG